MVVCALSRADLQLPALRFPLHLRTCCFSEEGWMRVSVGIQAFSVLSCWGLFLLCP